jgi:Microcystin-dependent protein
MEIRYYDKNLILKGEVPRYEQTTQTKYINAVGSFEIITDILPPGLEMGDIILSTGGEVFCGEITQISGDISLEKRIYKIKGREMVGVLSDRMPFNNNAPLKFTSQTREDIITQMVDKTCITPDDLSRKFPNMILAQSQGRGTTISYTAATDKSVFDNAVDVGKEASFGVEITPDIVERQYICRVVVPDDHGESASEPVIISKKYDNLLEEHTAFSKAAHKNLAYYGITENDVTTFNTVSLNAGTGFDLKERWISASENMDSQESIEAVITMQLGNFQPVASFTGDYRASQTFIFGEDFKLGDFIYYAGETGSSTRQVIGYTQTDQAGKYTLQLLFGNNLVETVKAIQQVESSAGRSVTPNQRSNCPYDVGDIYMTTISKDPSQKWAGTTWAAWGAGRVPVGIDASDADFDAVEKTGGSKMHTLNTNELPTTTYTDTLVTTLVTVSDTGGNWWLNNRGGGNQPHNNLQPYITCYMWKRTA